MLREFLEVKIPGCCFTLNKCEFVVFLTVNRIFEPKNRGKFTTSKGLILEKRFCISFRG